jgi:hypothetical protein
VASVQRGIGQRIVPVTGSNRGNIIRASLYERVVTDTTKCEDLQRLNRATERKDRRLAHSWVNLRSNRNFAGRVTLPIIGVGAVCLCRLCRTAVDRVREKAVNESGQRAIVWRQRNVGTGLNHGSWAYCVGPLTLIKSIAREFLSQTPACWVQNLQTVRAGMSLDGFWVDMDANAVNQRRRLSGVRFNADV